MVFVGSEALPDQRGAAEHKEDGYGRPQAVLLVGQRFISQEGKGFVLAAVS